MTRPGDLTWCDSDTKISQQMQNWSMESYTKFGYVAPIRFRVIGKKPPGGPKWPPPPPPVRRLTVPSLYRVSFRHELHSGFELKLDEKLKNLNMASVWMSHNWSFFKTQFQFSPRANVLPESYVHDYGQRPLGRYSRKTALVKNSMFVSHFRIVTLRPINGNSERS